MRMRSAAIIGVTAMAAAGGTAAQAAVGAFAAEQRPIVASTDLVKLGGHAGFRLRTETTDRRDALAARTMRTDPGFESALQRRVASSMFDYYPVGDGLRVSAGARFDAKRGKGSLDRLADGVSAGSGSKRLGSGRSMTPAMTLGYGVGSAEGGQFSIEAGATYDRNHNPLRLDMTDPIAAARIARRSFAGRGDVGIGEVVRVSYARRF